MTNDEKLISEWKREEEVAHIHGWDFSHIAGRCTEETDIPWDYRSVILERLTDDMRLLDIDTGGGEFLLSLGHPHASTAACEAYPPNIALCRERLLPLGVDFRAGDADRLPFEDASFDMIINRHGDWNASEIRRTLRRNGLFITQQVGAENNRELVTLLLGDTPLPFPGQYAEKAADAFRAQGFDILDRRECFRPIVFYDVGALVWFARIIEWEFPRFSVDACREPLLRAQRLIEENGRIEGRIHRFLLIARRQ